jgi:hypothetical protein
MLVRLGVQAIAVRGVERTLAQGEPSEKALAKMQQGLEAEIKVPLLLIGAREERAIGDRAMQALQDGNLNIKTFIASWSRQPGQLGLQELALYLPGSYHRNRTALLKLENKFVEVAKLPVEEQAQRIKGLSANLAYLPILARLILPAMEKVGGATFRIQAEMRCTLVLVAAERYRKAHGRWPRSPDELVPEYLAQVPTDPFDGKLIRMKPVKDGLIIYSIGLDEKDNNGTLGRGPRYTKEGTDLGWELWNVDRRRLPYRPPQKEE